MNDMLYKKIEDLGLSVRSTNCLHAENITLVSELVRLTEKQVLKTRNIGKKQLSEIEGALARHGLEFGTHVPDEGTIVKIDLDADYILQAYTREYKNSK
jgi:DNA-directed RNA polymerase subunit alpha